MALRTAVIGGGVMGRGHLRHLAEIPDVTRVAVVDPYEDTAREAAAEAGPEVRAFVDVDEMLAVARPEYVVVASPPRYHAQQCIAAFQAGAHVLCEKPLCMSVEEARTIEAAAQAAGRLFTMGVQLRQNPAWRRLREFLAAGGLGEIYHTRVWGGHRMGYPWGRYFHRKDMSLGGVLAGTVVHYLDLAYWVIGAPEPVTASASTFRRLDRMPDPPVNFEGKASDATVEDFAHGHVRLADGSSMSIEGNWLMHPTPRAMGFEINGVLGVASTREPYVELEQGREVVIHDLGAPPLVGPDYVAQHLEFVTAIRDGGESVVSIREAVNVQRILVGMYESAERGSEVRV